MASYLGRPGSTVLQVFLPSHIPGELVHTDVPRRTPAHPDRNTHYTVLPAMSHHPRTYHCHAYIAQMWLQYS